ncbi:MAG: energy transducer TonB [Acidobacteriota bacterium]|nr:energy transducer TonB [Acidobacteriota bacterium]MDE3264586.1 energy transducer TonB [Acidobacteriota bacterium]
MTAVSPASLNRIVGAVLALAVAFTLGFVVRSQFPGERESAAVLEAAAVEVLREAAEQRQSAAVGVALAAGTQHSMMLPESNRPVKAHDVAPQYPDLAREARIQGVVILKTLIDDEGNVADIEVLKSLPMGLSEAAVDAVKQWKFRPAMVDGTAVPANHHVTVNFRLDKVG